MPENKRPTHCGTIEAEKACDARAGADRLGGRGFPRCLEVHS